MIGKHFDIYLLLFLTIAIFSVFVFSKAFPAHANNISNKKINNFELNYRYVALAFVLLTFYAIYISMIPMWEEFTYQDNNIFWKTLENGKQHYGIPIWYERGRFFPFGHQEFELVSKISSSNFAYHAFSVIEIIAIFFISLKTFGARIGTLFFVVLSLTPEFVQTFFGLIYPERNMALLILLGLYFMNTGINNNSKVRVCASVLLLSLFLFYKETAFLVTAGISFSVLASYLLMKDNKLKLTSSFSIFLISMMWLASYIIDIYPSINDSYGGGHQTLYNSTTLLLSTPWTYVSLVSFGIMIFKKNYSTLFILPLVGIGYSLVMYFLNFKMPYYHLPSCLISIYSLFMSVGNLSVKWKLIVLSLISILTAFIARESIDIVKDRKETVFAKADALNYIYKNNYDKDARTLKASFNNVDSWTGHILTGYLRNKYKFPMGWKSGGDCGGVDYALYFNKKPKNVKFYTSESVPMWESSYKVYVVKCR